MLVIEPAAAQKSSSSLFACLSEAESEWLVHPMDNPRYRKEKRAVIVIVVSMEMDEENAEFQSGVHWDLVENIDKFETLENVTINYTVLETYRIKIIS